MIFSIFENCKEPYDTSSIILFGSFIENLLYMKPLQTEDLTFYFNRQNIPTTDENIDLPSTNTIKFYNIIKTIDYFNFNRKKNSVIIYNVDKNGIKFNINFHDYRPFDTYFFNLQNIEIDSFNGLKMKYGGPDLISKQIIKKNTGLLDILMYNYLGEVIRIPKIIPQNYMSNIITIQNKYERDGYTIKGGIKKVMLTEPCVICYQSFVMGVFLTCSHSFCITCIKTHLTTNNNNVLYIFYYDQFN